MRILHGDLERVSTWPKRGLGRFAPQRWEERREDGRKRARTRRVQRDLAGGARTPGTVKPKKENERSANHANHAEPKGVAEPEQLSKEGNRFGLRILPEVVLLSRV